MPDELRRRFEEQVEGILARRIGSVGRIARAVCAIVGSAIGLFSAQWLLFTAFCFAEGARFREAGLWVVAFAAIFVLTATGVFHCVYDLKRGIVAPRKVQKASFAIRYACVFVIGIFVPITALGWHAPGEDLMLRVWIACLIAFFWWSVAVALALHRITRWNYEDVMLEVKRTQLQIALLDERLAGKAEAK